MARASRRRLSCARPHARGCMFRPIDPKQDLVELEHGVLALWQERRTFARLRAQLAGKPHWSFLDGPITANNPMGVHHAWGRMYKDLYQRFHAMHGAGPALPERLRLPGPVGRGQRRARPGLHLEARHRGIRHRRVRVALQATRSDLRRAHDRAVAAARHVDGLERSRRAAPHARPPRRGSDCSRRRSRV